MSQPSNIKEQLEAARGLRDLILSDLNHPGTAGEAATSAIMGAVKRIALVGVEGLPTSCDKMETISHVCAFLGEFIGMSLRGMPPAVIDATMAHFAQEMSEAFGAPVMAVGIGAATTTSQQKEPLH